MFIVFGVKKWLKLCGVYICIHIQFASSMVCPRSPLICDRSYVMVITLLDCVALQTMQSTSLDGLCTAADTEGHLCPSSTYSGHVHGLIM